MIKIISKDKTKMSFLANMPETLANAIRRSALEIPILAVDEVEFFKNDSALYDEILAHRIGLIPLVNEKNIKEAELKIKIKGPGTVYSKDLKGKVDVVYGNIPIVILDKEQELELLASAKFGKGIEHAKFSPGLIYYRNLAQIISDKGCDECKKCVEACPHNLLIAEKGKIALKEAYKCDLCEACVEACKKQNKEAIKIEKSEDLVFFIESWGQIKAEDIFIRAIESLQDNLKELTKEIK